MRRRFHLPFQIVTNDKLEAARTGNWFLESDLVIARLDKLWHDDAVQAKLATPDGRCDLVVCDEAHKLSATVSGGEIKYTRRYRLSQLLSTLTRHLLLMTATPHNGKEEDFWLFMALLDGDQRLLAGGALRFFSFDCAPHSTAIVLSALARLDPNSTLTTNAVRWLVAARKASAWETNQENAWAVMALSAWRDAVGDATPDYTWRVLLNDASVLNGVASPSNVAHSESLSVPVAQLARNQGNELVFEHGASEGRLYYTARLKVFLPAGGFGARQIGHSAVEGAGL